MNDTARPITTAEEISDEFGGALKKRLDARLSKLATHNAAVIVRKYYDLLSNYRDMGMPWEVIAEELAALGCTITARSLSTTFSRAKKAVGQREHLAVVSSNVSPIAPPAREGGEQSTAQALPAKAPAAVTSIETAQAPASRPAPVPQQRPLPGEKNEERRPIWMTDEMWAIKPKIDKILSTYPTPDREYPELADSRLWTDKTGKKWDVIGDEKPDSEEERRELDYANIRYFSRWRGLVEKWGLAEEIRGDLIPRYKIAKEHRKPLLVDLDEIIAKHLD
jgi:hypothetical protein